MSFFIDSISSALQGLQAKVVEQDKLLEEAREIINMVDSYGWIWLDDKCQAWLKKLEAQNNDRLDEAGR